MQVKFSTFIIALSFLTYLFGVVFTSPVPNKVGSPRSSLTRSSSGPATLSSQTHSSRPSSPVQRQPTPMAPESPKTRKEWHKNEARKWGKHTRETGGTAKEFGNKAIQSAQQGNYMEAAKNAGKSCVMGMICGGAAAVKAIHTHKANKPVS